MKNLKGIVACIVISMLGIFLGNVEVVTVGAQSAFRLLEMANETPPHTGVTDGDL